MEVVVDYTEPEPLEVVEGIEDPYVEPFLWRVELYLMSKYAPEFVEATIWKVRSAVLERAKIVKEHHIVISSLSELTRIIENDFDQYVQGTTTGRFKPGTAMRQSPRPDIGSDYAQRELR